MLHKCEHCDHTSKSTSQLKEHLADSHDIGVTWHECEHCDHKTKSASHLKQHYADAHDIGAT